MELYNKKEGEPQIGKNQTLKMTIMIHSLRTQTLNLNRFLEFMQLKAKFQMPILRYFRQMQVLISNSIRRKM